ncbi:CHASE domain-containing protein [Serratia sp. DD3]|uniref:CHASE domain-containing protein n=1 Tax=Serratia sp. DD3 TaxID=1410619 RepID=UPI0004D923CD|nr:CHASE domain-containing protein [Serratia sp. DD3]KEY60712.1 signal transduction histidine-protein kinase BarA [Serratia sp. DD3]
MTRPQPEEATRTARGKFSFAKNRLIKINLLPLMLFIVGVALSAVGTWQIYREIEDHAKIEFKNDVERVSGELVRRFLQTVNGLNGARGVYATNNHLTRAQFRAYVASRDLPVDFPGVRGFGFIQRVERNNLDEFIKAVRADGAPEFTLRQLNDKNYNDLYIIKFLEPAKGNKGAEGLDIGSEAVRRAAALSAINTGNATLTGAVSLVQESRKIPGVLLYVPVYATGSMPTTPEQRQESLVGLVYSPIVISDLLNDIPEFVNRRVNIELFDSINNISTQNLIFDASANKESDFITKEAKKDQFEADGEFVDTSILHLPGRDMTLRVSRFANYEDTTERYASWLLFLLGCLLSGVLALFLRQQINGRYRAERLAYNMTADLERLALVAKNTSNAVVITDINRLIVWVNEGFERITGYSKSEVLGKSPGALLQCANSDKKVLAQMGNALYAGESFKGEIINCSKSGKEYWIELEIQPRYNDKNEAIGFMAIESDISERKATYFRLEAALRENNALLSTLNLYGIVSSADCNGQIIDVNDAFCSISGYKREELIGNNYRMLESHAHSLEFWLSMWSDISSGIPWRGVICNKSKSGELYWVDTTIAPFKNSAGEIDRYVSIQTDITASKNQQASLIIARNQLVRAADVAELGVWSWNIPEGTLSFDERMNDIYALPLELRHGPISQDYWFDLLHPEDRQDVASALNQALEGEDVYRQDFRVVIDNQVRFIQSTGTVERDENGHPVLMMGINRDITQQRENENILRAARQAAEEANSAKSAFLATMSHELRTPMNAILGMMTLLRKTGLNTKQADYAVKIEAAARSLLHLLNDILDFSKVESGKMVLECIPFNIHEMLRDLSVILSGNLKVKSVEVLFDIDPQLPTFVEGDSMRLQQVLTNLGSNALKFTEKGEVVLFIKVVKKESHYVTLQFGVRDTGIGIAPEHQERIFSAFTQAEASITRRFGGTGLGLVISQRFVSLMGGTLQLESQLGFGSLFHFTVTLPIPSQPLSGPQISESLANKVNVLHQLRVLVIDDNLTSCNLIKRMGESLNWTVDVATSGNDALQLINTQREQGMTYGALFIDWKMPGLDGWQTSKAVRELMSKGNSPMIVMITAHGREMLLARSEEDQTLIDGYLIKPITASMLLDSVTDVLSHNNQSDNSKMVQQTSSHRLEGIRLLVVEDNLNNQQIARELLEDEGAIVQIANQGLEAIDILQDNSALFDVVLMDLQMPVMDGLTAARYIRGTLGLADLPIIAMTANAMTSDRDACLAAGMNDHIGKPFELNNLIRVIRKYSKRPELVLVASENYPSSPLGQEWKNVAAAAGIDFTSAIDRLGGDIELYQNMLLLFSSELADFPQQLDKFVVQQDWPALSRLLHTLKGLAAQLGAPYLSQMASDGEQLLKNSPTLPSEGMARLFDEVKNEAQSIQMALVQLSQLSPDDVHQAASKEETDTHPILSELNALIALLQNSDMAALEVMRKLQTNFGHHFGEQLRPLSDAINQLDFTLAIEVSQALLSALSIQGESHNANK